MIKSIFRFDKMWTSLVAILVIIAVSNADQEEIKVKTKRSYVCPPNFLRLSNKCYYFSNTTATFQDAYWKCKDLHSNIATIRNGNQDKLLRRTLDHDKLEPLERWIGGRYDWGTRSWIWAASGKTVQYQGFTDHVMPSSKESLVWHCIILDPSKKYRWSSRSCTDMKNYICQTKIRTVSNKDKKKLQLQYNANKFNKLNEVPVPEINSNSVTNHINYKYFDNNELSNLAYARRPKETKIRKRKSKKNNEVTYKSVNGTMHEVPKLKHVKGKGNKARRNMNKERKRHNGSIDNIKWKTYYVATKSPLHPRGIVEEFTYR